jgi:methionine biosynthesis protein MetW
VTVAPPDSDCIEVPATLRPDLRAIAEMIPQGTRVLDLGCGDGELLAYITGCRDVKGRGVEISEAGVLACVRRGLSVRQGNLQDGLADYPDNSFDFVVLSQTLPFLDDPAMILHEILRVGKSAIVSLPNWGYWQCRVSLLFTGRIPKAVDLPQSWYQPPRWQAVTITDFARFCQQIGIRIVRQVYLERGRRINVYRMKNLRATTGIFMLTQANS